MKLPCFCAILVGSLTRGSPFLQQRDQVSFFHPLGGLEVFLSLLAFFLRWGEDVLFVGDLYKRPEDYSFLKKIPHKKEAKRCFFPNLLLLVENGK